VWANLSEKLSDRFGMTLKYGGGPEDRRNALLKLSDRIYLFERLEETYIRELGGRSASEMSEIHMQEMTNVVSLRRQIEELFDAAISDMDEKQGI
jgi:hypothetical protein